MGDGKIFCKYCRCKFTPLNKGDLHCQSLACIDKANEPARQRLIKQGIKIGGPNELEFAVVESADEAQEFTYNCIKAHTIEDAEREFLVLVTPLDTYIRNSESGNHIVAETGKGGTRLFRQTASGGVQYIPNYWINCTITRQKPNPKDYIKDK